MASPAARRTSRCLGLTARLGQLVQVCPGEAEVVLDPARVPACRRPAAVDDEGPEALGPPRPRRPNPPDAAPTFARPPPWARARSCAADPKRTRHLPGDGPRDRAPPGSLTSEGCCVESVDERGLVTLYLRAPESRPVTAGGLLRATRLSGMVASDDCGRRSTMPEALTCWKLFAPRYEVPIAQVR